MRRVRVGVYFNVGVITPTATIEHLMDQAEFEFLQELRNPVTSKAMNEWLDDKLASREKEGLSLVNKHLRELTDKLEARNRELEKMNSELNARIQLVLLDKLVEARESITKQLAV